MESELKLPWPIFKSVFKLKNEEERKYYFYCLLCPSKPVLTADKSSAGNLKKHMKVTISFYINNDLNSPIILITLLLDGFET